MEEANKIRLSTDYIFTKLVFIFGLCFSFAASGDLSNNDITGDFKNALEYKIAIIVFSASLIYFFTRPKIYYDEVNLYIKKINKPKIAIPLKSVVSFFENPFFAKGISSFTIEFKNNLLDNDSIEFKATYYSDSIKNFKTLIKKINPHVEIV